MIKIGITGQEGFVGQHLYNTLGLFPDEFERVLYNIDFFHDQEKLNTFVLNCNVIIHLAAMNRHNDPNVIYETNIGLVNKLLDALNVTNSKAHVLFASSSQEEKDNLYGKSKKEGRELLSHWSRRSGGKFTGLVIPNVFGPFGHPYFNSFIATFCYQLSHNEEPKIDVDGEVKLIYVGELVERILNEIRAARSNDCFVVPYTAQMRVSSILELLKGYKDQYMSAGIIPVLNNKFELNLFNTFRCYMDIKSYFPVKFAKHADFRGAFMEIIRVNVGGQVSFSTTLPGVTRGNHYHTRKIERFAIIKGKALIQLRRIGTEEVIDFYLDGSSPAYVDMPIWYTHNIKNLGDEELYTNFWINEFFDPNDADTYIETV
jgi:UDP-2-acetamido-2,6-beta-L-arabino-hexul-4-ose reductase